VGVVLDLNDGENNDTSPTTWEVALESMMKTTLVRRGGTALAHDLRPGVFICERCTHGCCAWIDRLGCWGCLVWHL